MGHARWRSSRSPGKKSWTKVRLMVEKCKLSGNPRRKGTSGVGNVRGIGERREEDVRWPLFGGWITASHPLTNQQKPLRNIS